MMMAGQCTPHVVGRNSAAPFPAKAENSAQAPFLPPLPTGPASLGSGGGPSFRLRRKEKTGCARSKREKDAGAEFDRRGQIHPNYGGWSEPVPIKLANLLPGALDSVPCGGALPHLRLPTRLFWCVDARTFFSSRASRLACPVWTDSLLPPVDELSSPHAPSQARSAGRGARDLASKKQNTLGGSPDCGGAPTGGTESDAAGRRPAIHGSTDSGQPPYLGEFDPCGQIPPQRLFSFGPCTARFLFSAQPKRENGGCIAQPSSWLKSPPPVRASTPYPSRRESADLACPSSPSRRAKSAILSAQPLRAARS